MTTSYTQVSPRIEESHNVISIDNVKLALFDRFQQTDQMNPLERLAIIDQVVSNFTFPHCIYSRRFALWEVLTTIITKELIKHRQVMEIESRPPETSIREAFTAIFLDGKTGNAELVGWSWLYYRCVRIDLGIQQKKFCEIVCLDDRTIRRYQDKTIWRIMDILLNKEWKARERRLVMKINKNHVRQKYLRGSQNA